MAGCNMLLIVLVVLASTYIEAAGRFRRSECTDSQKTQCETKLFTKHYTDSGCTANWDDKTCCPSSYNCTLLYDIAKTDYKGCYFRGQKYEESIETGDPCQTCSCRDKQSVNCVVYDCPIEMQGFKEGCVMTYDQGSCCAKNHPCGAEALPKKGGNEVTCNYDGKTYIEGQRIEDFPNRPCTICTCTSDFKGPDSPSCHNIACMVRDLDTIQQGCLPVYVEGVCCPIEWHCPNRFLSAKGTTKSGGDKFVKFTASPQECVFEGKSYTKGSTIDIGQDGVTCSCDMPPLATCIRK